MIPILILAAGQSSRMAGRDKLAEPIDGVPLLTKIARSAFDVSDQVFVALPSPDHPRAALLSDCDAEILSVPEAAEGMSGTMRGAVAQLPPCPAFMLVLGDLAEIGADEMNAVLRLRQDTPNNVIWRGATSEGKHGHPIIFDAALRPEFAQLAGDGGGEPLVKAHLDQTAIIRFDDGRARLDLDTPEDWAAYRARTGL